MGRESVMLRSMAIYSVEATPTKRVLPVANAVVIALLPVAGIVGAAWIGLNSNGYSSSPWTWVAIGLYLIAPTVAALVASRSSGPVTVLTLVALAEFALIEVVWVTSAPTPSKQPGVFGGYQGFGVGLTLAFIAAIGLRFASLVARTLIKRRLWPAGLVVAAVIAGTTGLGALILSPLVPF
jgi:hypothetical protein